MNEFEKHERATELGDTLTSYASARSILESPDMILYALKVPFIDDYMYLTEGSGIDTHHKLFDTLEEAEEAKQRWKGSKVVAVTFKDM